MAAGATTSGGRSTPSAGALQDRDHAAPDRPEPGCVGWMARIACAAIALALVGVGEPASARVSSSVAALQVALRAERLYGGSVDGVAGPGTRSAVQAFQRRRGLA